MPPLSLCSPLPLPPLSFTLFLRRFVFRFICLDFFPLPSRTPAIPFLRFPLPIFRTPHTPPSPSPLATLPASLAQFDASPICSATSAAGCPVSRGADINVPNGDITVTANRSSGASAPAPTERARARARIFPPQASMTVARPFNEYDFGARKILTVPFVNYSARPRRIYTSFVRRTILKTTPWLPVPFHSIVSLPTPLPPPPPFIRPCPAHTPAEYA